MVWFDLTSQRSNVQLASPKGNIYYSYLFKIAVLTLKLGILEKVLGRVGLYPFFPKNIYHTFTCFCLLLCCVCSDLCFYFIFNQPYNIVTSSIFKFVGLLTLVCSTCIKLCFDWTLNLTKFSNSVLEGIFTKGKKTNDH